MSMNWPLHRISEPHETNDVVLGKSEYSASSSRDVADANQQDHSSYWSDLLEPDSYPAFQGNRRFLKLLQEKQEDYGSKTRLEKPLISVELLKKWRGQTPPGRFLVVEESTKPPLWQDIGDKKARSYISKALKHMASNTSNGKRNSEPTTSSGILFQDDEKKDSNDSAPAIPRFRPQRKSAKRISDVLNQAQNQGKLFGRWDERDQLRHIFETKRQRTGSVVDVVLISGDIGVGKSALARTLVNPYDEGDEENFSGPSFFLEGKFERLRNLDPNAAFVAVISDFCNQLRNRNSPTLTDLYRDAIFDVLDNNTMLLTNLVPACASILNSGSDMDSSSNVSSISTTLGVAFGKSQGALAMQRIKKVFRSFLQAISTVDPQNPVVVFLDDLHWASERALDILTFLVSDLSNQSIIFVGTFHETEDPKRTLGENNRHFDKLMKKLTLDKNIRTHALHLNNLPEHDVEDMLSETLSLDHEQVKSLRDLVFSVTGGNPTFMAELLRSFQEEGTLQFDEGSKQWKCDFHMVPFKLQNIDSVADLWKAKILNLPNNIRESLKVAACLGSSEIDEKILQMIDSSGAVESHLKHAFIKGILRCENSRYSFATDGVQEAIYDLIPHEEKPSYHLKIGKKLWTFHDDLRGSDLTVVLLRQLMVGDHLLEDANDRRAVAALCLQAGKHSAKSSGFQTASVYLSHGISILSGQKMWGHGNYDLSLALHNALIEVCYCNAEFEELESLVREVLRSARSFEDSLLARGTQIYALGSRNRQREAIEVAIQALEGLKERFPSAKKTFSFQISLYLALRRVKRLLQGLSEEELLRLPPMRDHTALATMQILNHIILYTFYAEPAVSCYVIIRMVELTVKYGLSTISSVAFAFYAVVVSGGGSGNVIEEGYRYGQLSLKLYDKYRTEEWLCRTSAAFYGCVYNWKKPAYTCIEPLERAYRVGLVTGDIEYAMLNASLLIWNTRELTSLPQLESQIRQLGKEMDFLGQSLSGSMLTPLLQMVLNFMGQAFSDPRFLQGQAVDKHIQHAKNGFNPCMLDWVNFYTMKLSYFFSDYDRAEQYSYTSKKLYSHAYGGVDTAYVLFYETLVLLAQARKKRNLRRRWYIFEVRKGLKRLSYWALHSPFNFLGKQYLVQAELAVVQNDHQSAMSNYRSAILHSRESGSDVQTALCNERLGKYLLEKDDLETSRPFLEEAYRLYGKWGGLAKMQHLKDEIHCTFLA